MLTGVPGSSHACSTCETCIVEVAKAACGLSLVFKGKESKSRNGHANLHSREDWVPGEKFISRYFPGVSQFQKQVSFKMNISPQSFRTACNPLVMLTCKDEENQSVTRNKMTVCWIYSQVPHIYFFTVYQPINLLSVYLEWTWKHPSSYGSLSTTSLEFFFVPLWTGNHPKGQS